MQLQETQNTSNNGKPKCLGYVRVSTPDQRDNGLSLDVQQTQIITKVQELNGELVEDVYVDGGVSGTSLTNRLAFQEILTRCANGDIDFVIVQDSSRVARNTLEYLVIKQTLRKYNTKIIPLTGIVSFDDNPFGDAIDELIAVIHSIPPRLTSYKVKQTAAEKFKAGYYPSVAPLGYNNVVNKNPTGVYDKKIVVPDPTRAPFITKAFQMYATRDYSIYDIRQYLHKNGVLGRKGRPIQFSVTHTMLKNKFYWGWMQHGGHEGMGKHTSLIDKETFDLVQRILSEKGTYGLRRRTHNFLLRGLIFCRNCKKRYTAEWHYHPKFKTRGGRIGYYHCSQVGKRGQCDSKYVELENLEKQVQEEVAKLEFTQEFVDAVTTNIKQVYDNSVGLVKTAKKALCNRRDGIEMKREKLEAQLMEGNVGGEAFKRINAKLDSELLDIQKELAEQDKVRTIDISAIDEVLFLTQNIVKAYNKADIDHKRAYLHFFFQKIWLQDKRIVEVEYSPALKVLNEAKLGIISTENHNSNIATKLACTIKTFEDFRLVQQIREEIEKVRPSLVPAVA
ncbi:recombinase family protein [Candidatus Microgenomates bacterium]|nr:recombinase family protein [Candidatus Microgenomates bacterium]